MLRVSQLHGFNHLKIGGDPYWSYVEFLSGFDTTINDEVGSATFGGTAPLYSSSSTQEAFGEGSAYVTGNDGYHYFTSDFTLPGAFTVEAWLYHAAANYNIFGISRTSDSASITVSSALKIVLSLSGGGGQISSDTDHPVNTWYHLAIVRDSSNVCSIYINGTKQSATKTITGTFSVEAPSYKFVMNNSVIAVSNGYNGYLDELRITSIDRYSVDFAVPTEAFPRS